MPDKATATPRETYQAYLRGDITPEQAEKAVQIWYASSQPSTGRPPRRE